MSKKYKNSLYPDKVNDLIDNDGFIVGEALQLKTINGESVIGEGDLVIGGGESIELKTINNQSLIGEGNIEIDSGTEVVANPEVSGEEDNLTSIKIDGTDFIIPAGTEVIANTKVSGGESNLNNIKIDGVTYLIPSGGGGGYSYLPGFGIAEDEETGEPMLVEMQSRDEFEPEVTYLAYMEDLADSPIIVAFTCYEDQETGEIETFNFTTLDGRPLANYSNSSFDIYYENIAPDINSIFGSLWKFKLDKLEQDGTYRLDMVTGPEDPSELSAMHYILLVGPNGCHYLALAYIDGKSGSFKINSVQNSNLCTLDPDSGDVTYVDEDAFVGGTPAPAEETKYPCTILYNEVGNVRATSIFIPQATFNEMVAIAPVGETTSFKMAISVVRRYRKDGQSSAMEETLVYTERELQLTVIMGESQDVYTVAMDTEWGCFENIRLSFEAQEDEPAGARGSIPLYALQLPIFNELEVERIFKTVEARINDSIYESHGDLWLTCFDYSGQQLKNSIDAYASPSSGLTLYYDLRDSSGTFVSQYSDIDTSKTYTGHIKFHFYTPAQSEIEE